MNAAIMIGGALTLLVLRQPIYVVVGAIAFYCYVVLADNPVTYLTADIWSAINQEVLVSIPLFIAAGNVMSAGSITKRLVNVIRELMAPIPGGLAVATVIACAVFSAISGSSTVTLLAVGSIMYPVLLQEGYSKRFALGALCAAGTLGIIVPPSIPMILYGFMTQTSIPDLFLAGVGPAILLTSFLVLYSLWVNREFKPKRLDYAALFKAVREGILAIFAPMIILGGIYSGYFTTTESAVVALLYGIVIECLVYRSLSFRQLGDTIIETGRMMGVLFPVLAFALAINIYANQEQVPQQLVAWLSALIDSKAMFIMLFTVLLLIAGCFMDVASAIIVFAPILQPIADSYGLDPIHVGIMMTVNLEIGYLTPPLGLNLIVAMAAFKEGFGEIVRAALPFIAILLVVYLIVAFFPILSLFLLN